MGASRWARGARATLAAGAAVALVACASEPWSVQYERKGSYNTTFDGLRRVKGWGFADAFVKPGADLTHYDRVVVDGVGIAYKAAANPERATRDGLEYGTYLLSPHVTKWFKRHLQKALAIELDKSEAFSVAQRPAPDAIQVYGYIVDLVVRVPPNQGVGQGYTSFRMNRGEFTLILDVRDSQSGAPLLRVADHAAIKFDGGLAHLPSDSATNAMAVRLIFQQAALQLRQHLDALHALAEIPPAPHPTS